ncbi:hypothetical protein HN011_008409 [Eciton burchellii]|nr:hypothetical protein HN011_008409 [Eciton burchellii]
MSGLLQTRVRSDDQVASRHSADGSQKYGELTNRRFDERRSNAAPVDDYRDDLPQCGYYRTAGKNLSFGAFEERKVYTARFAKRATRLSHRYTQSLRPHCGPACGPARKGPRFIARKKEKEGRKKGKEREMP